MTVGRTRIKICGITSPEIAEAAVRAGADAIGVVFAPGSPRAVTPETAAVIRAAVPPLVSVVGVFQDPGDEDDLLRRATCVDVLQLHGRLGSIPEEITRPVIRAVRFDAAEVRRADADPAFGAVLVDGPRSGSGVRFEHGELAAVMPDLTGPILLAGGLSPDNVADAIRTVRPYAVDVSSGVESAPGVKDEALIRAFCDAVRLVSGSAR